MQRSHHSSHQLRPARKYHLARYHACFTSALACLQNYKESSIWNFFSFWANSFFSQYGTFPWGGWTDQVAGCLAVAWLERAQCWASCPPPHWSCSPGLLYLSSRATLPNVRWPSALHSYRRCHRNTGIQATAPGAGPPVREPLESFTRKGRFRHFYLDMSDCLAEWGGEYVSPSLVTTALLSTLFSIGPALVILNSNWTVAVFLGKSTVLQVRKSRFTTQ